MRSSSLFALAASLASVSAVFQGFNYGATKSDGSFMFQADYEAKFKNAKELVGTNGGFTSARLYTMIQGGSSTNEPTSAIPAAINQGVSLLLGLWASGGEGGMQAEITALKAAIAQYGDKFTSLVAGISIGSEDLYRISPTGIAALSGYGANPEDIVKYIGEVKSALQGTALSGASFGHVDTWTAWVNGSNSAVVDAVDWIGFDAYPYFQNTMENSVSTGKQLFNDALAATQAASKGKPVWITETGWPVSGKTENKAIPNTDNAKTYWDEVGCPLFGNVNTWWYTQQDADPVTPNPSFGVIGSTLSTTPLYDLSCDDISSKSSSASSTASSTATGTSSAESTTGSVTTEVGASSTTTVGSSAIASLSSEAAASTPLATGGGGLSPNQGVPTLVNPSATPTGAPSSGVGSNGTIVVSPTLSATTVLLSTTTGTGSGTGSSSGPTVTSNSAVALSGSLVGVLGAFLAAVAAL